MTEMPLTPEIIEPKYGSLRRSSLTPEVIELKGGSLRKCSLTPELTGPKDGSLRSSSSLPPELTGPEDGSGEKILPHYLRASTGSCHDFCKYGRHHAFAAKEKHSLRKGNKTWPSEGQSQRETVRTPTRKKKPAVELVSSHGPGTQSCDAPEIEKQKREIVKQKPVTPDKQGIRTTLSEGQYQIMSSAQTKKKKPAVKSVSSHDPGTQICDSQEIEKQEIVKQKPLSSDKKENRTTSSVGQYQIKSVAESRKKKPAVKSVFHDPGTQSCDTPKNGEQETDIVKQKPLSPDKKENKTTSSEGQYQTKRASPQTRTKPAIRLVSSRDPGAQSCDISDVEKQEKKISQQKAASPVKKIAEVVKSSFALKPRHFSEKLPSSLSPKDQSGRRDTDIKTGKNSDASKVVQKKHQVPQKATLYLKPSVNRTSSDARNYRLSPPKKETKVQKDDPELPNDEIVSEKTFPPKKETKVQKDDPELPNDEIVSEKTLYVIETKPEKKSVELGPAEDGSLPSLSYPSTSSSSSSSPSLALNEEEYSESEYEETETDSEYDETGTDSASDEIKDQNQLETSKEEYKRRPRRVAMIHPEDNDPGHKLKFRRGKVVDLQSENTEPRRLRFRRGRVLGDDQNGKGEGRRKSFKKREVGDGATTGEAESGKVVLRHQDVNGKKDAQGLFNNVIEETASKLAETRLSKVKALVGAFETVISLQESHKPSATSSG